LSDHKKYPNVFPKVHPAYFMTIWRRYFGEIIKLRKYTRFAKCKVCIELRRLKGQRSLNLAVRSKLDAQINEHYHMIKRYRARARKHGMLGQTAGTRVVSGAQDGTEQLGYGYPKSAEFDKSVDSWRIKTKVMVSFLHGKLLTYYVLPENVAGDPNTAIECIQRTLKDHEKTFGRLPKTYYFQADNCPRESKNTYQLAYFAWLIERRVFDTIYLSFHPVGHTHNECDQCASRISIAVRNSDILCRCEFFELLRMSYSPKPKLVHLTKTADFKRLVNLSDSVDFAKLHGAKVRRARRITESLLFKLERDHTGRPFVRERATIEEGQWSEPWYPFHNHPSGIDLAELRGNRFNIVADDRRAAIEKTLANCEWRMNAHQIRCVKADFELLKRVDDPEAPPSVAWTPFLAETDPVSEPSDSDSCGEAEEEKVRGLRARPLPVLGTHKDKRELRTGQYARLDRSLVVGRWVVIDRDNGSSSLVSQWAESTT
jgi:hypothetical protein